MAEFLVSALASGFLTALGLAAGFAIFPLRIHKV